MQLDDLDPVLLSRYFNGEGTEAEVQAVRRWIDANREHACLVTRLREVWRIAGEVPSEWDVEAALEAVRARDRRRAEVVSLEGWAGRRPELELLRPAGALWYTKAVRAAAAIAVVAGVGFVWRAETAAVRPAALATATRTFTTANAEQATITLSDGTRVILGPASTLRVPERFSPDERDVSLDGEAYFSVARDTLRPFTVASSNGLVRVLGTKFSVRDRADERGATVVVSEGRVSLAARDTSDQTVRTPVILTAGDLGRVTPDSAPRSVQGVDVGRYIGWTEGRLAFADAPLPAILAEVARWYDLEFRVADPELARRHLTTSFQHETVSQVLDVLAASLDARWSRAGRTVTLHRLQP